MGLRKHCNPLAFRHEVAARDWRDVFAAPGPLEVDVGYGLGGFIIDRAAAEPRRNFVGLEVREALTARMKEHLAAHPRPNLAIVFCNANWSFADLFAGGSLAAIHVYFPDPWFKRRHQKRRVLTPEFAAQCAARLEPGGCLFAKSDVPAVAAQMLEILDALAIDTPEQPARLKNLAGVGRFITADGFAALVPQQSNWERHLIRAGLPYDRLAYRKQA